MATEAETVQTKGCYPNFLPWFTQQRAKECLHRFTNFPCGDVMPAQREKVPGRVPRDGTNCLNYNEERNHATCTALAASRTYLILPPIPLIFRANATHLLSFAHHAWNLRNRKVSGGKGATGRPGHIFHADV